MTVRGSRGIGDHAAQDPAWFRAVASVLSCEDSADWFVTIAAAADSAQIHCRAGRPVRQRLWHRPRSSVRPGPVS